MGFTLRICHLLLVTDQFSRFTSKKKFDNNKNSEVNKPKGMENFAFLGDMAPGFAIRGCQVKVLTEPNQFFQELCQKSEKAQKRIAIAALYLGIGDKA